MLYSSALVLFESSEAQEVLRDPANADWLGLISSIDDPLYDLLARRYYLALNHFRRQRERSALQGRVEVVAQGKQAASQGMLVAMVERRGVEKKSASRDEAAIFVSVAPDKKDVTRPAALRDFSIAPPSERSLLDGSGRPPCDALCLLRAFLAASVMGGGDSPTEVFQQLHRNPTFARACGFLSREALKQPGELTSRRLPSTLTCEEFSEVMTRYGLWQLARIEQVQSNLREGVIEVEDTLAFDTTHIEAHSHCGNVVPPDAKIVEGKKPKHRKVPRMRKSCRCGKAQWEHCEHPWTPTDQGAGIVVKGPTRIYWAHKISVVSFGESGIPLDVRTLQYAAEHDGKTLVPHLELLEGCFPDVVGQLSYVLADDAYQGNHEAVAGFGQSARLIVPVHPSRRSKADVVAALDGIARFTPTGIPVCEAGQRFNLQGRDMSALRYIWSAPDDEAGASVCLSCPLRDTCLSGGSRRHIRVERDDFPQLNWEQPQHSKRDKARYAKRTSVERAIKRLKVDLHGAHLKHRDGPRVQGHIERKLLALHLLLKANSP